MSYGLQAQYAETIATGRPGQANGPFSVGKGIYQIQSGFYYFDTENDWGIQGLETQNEWVNNSIIRLGLKEDFELRIRYSFHFHDELSLNNEQSRADQNGLSDFAIGFRQSINEQNGIIPAFGIQFMAFAGGNRYYNQDNLNTELKFIAQHTITERLGLNSNLALLWLVDQQTTVAPYVLSLSYSISDKLSVLGEAYGQIEEERTSILFDGGIGYLLSNNFQVDCYAGYGNNRINPFDLTTKEFFVSAGVSYRLNRRD